MLKSLPATVLTLLTGAVLGHGLQDHGKQEHGKKEPGKPAAGQEMAMPKPGPEHAMLKKWCGEWDAAVHSMGQDSKGTQTTTALGEFFTVDDFRGEFGGQAFVGRGINGYDPLKKKYVGMWADSMSPTPTILWGTYDEKKKKELVMTGDSVGMDGKPCKMTNICRHKDDDHLEFVMMMPGADGKDAEMMKIEYTRKKK